MRYACILLMLALSACASASDDAKSELDTIRAAQAQRSGGRAADNAELCRAYTKLQDAYLRENNTKAYNEQKLHLAAYC